MSKQPPQIKSTDVFYKDRVFNLEYFYRQGDKETIILLHGLGGAKENYYEACKSPALTSHTLLFFDNPGTGNSTYFEDYPLNIDDLTEISSLFIKQLGISNFILCGTSMGGLTSLLYLKDCGPGNVKAYINIEGNLLPEDCMKSNISNTVLVIILLMLFSCSTIPKGITAVHQFDKSKYLGKWYEIARLDFKFERNLINTTAEYSINTNGTIKVFNKGYDTTTQKWKSATGKARFVKDENIGMVFRNGLEFRF